MIRTIFQKCYKAIIYSIKIKQTKASVAIKIPTEQHKINSSYISKNAIYVVGKLQKAGFDAFIVGGAVRDLILGIKPKDFDVSTSATPKQIQKLFSRAYLIGRRFQIVHIRFPNEIIEVSTFRGSINKKNTPNTYALWITNITRFLKNKIKQRHEKHKNAYHKRSGKYGHAINIHGQIIQDNIWGSQEEDASRRDLTMNAMYYDPIQNTILDYHHGFQDTINRSIKIIGDPNIRFREDPVRMLRAIRFAAKLNFELDKEVTFYLDEFRSLLQNVSPARLFDETLKLLLSGYAEITLILLKKLGFTNLLFPTLPTAQDKLGQKFIFLLLNNTDKRLLQKRHVSPGFTFAGLLWPAVRHQLMKNLLTCKSTHEALSKSIQIVIENQTEKLSIPKRYLSNMRDIWMMQPRFEKKQARSVISLLNHPKLRSGYDFLLLRCEAGEFSQEKTIWWTTLIEAEHKEKQKILLELQSNTHQ